MTAVGPRHLPHVLRAPKITAADAVLARRVARRFDAVRVHLNDAELALRLAPRDQFAVSADGPGQGMLRLELVAGEERVGVALPTGAARKLLDVFLSDRIDPASALGAVAFNVALDPVMLWLEEALDLRDVQIVRCAASPDPCAGRHVICLDARLDDDAFNVRLDVPTSIWDLAVARLEEAPFNGPALDCPIDVAIRRGALVLPARSLHLLRVGAVAIPDDPPIQRGHGVAIVGGCLHFSISLSTDRATVTSQPRVVRDADLIRSPIMQDPNGVADAGLGDIDIRVAFEVGRQMLPYSTVNRLAPGFVFDLARDPETAVDIVANGARIGHGEIVAIGDSIGIRITRMFGHE
jgi:type III secretion protein Q